MSHIDLGTDAKLTKSMVLDAIDMADIAKDLKGSDSYNDSQLKEAVVAMENEDQDLRTQRDRSGISESSMLKALNVVIKKRQNLTYLIHPFRKLLPKWMFMELPLHFMDRKIKCFDFLDKFTKKLKKI